MGRGRDYSDEMANLIDEEIELILRKAESRCHELLLENRAGLDSLAKSLLEKETLDSNEVFELLGITDFPGNEEGNGVEQSPNQSNTEIPAFQTYSKPEKS